MRRLLNTLYVMSQDGSVSKEGETLVITRPNEPASRFPVHNVEGIVLFGSMTCSTPFLQFCAEQGVAVTFLSEYGRYIGRFQGRITGNILLRKAQYRCADNETRAAEIAQSMVMAKIINARTILLRAIREGRSQESGLLSEKIKHLTTQLGQFQNQMDILTLRGVEGDCARRYFETFDAMVLINKACFRYDQRSRRPPKDPMNALLSYVYTLLMQDCAAALQSIGLDPACGFLHADRPGRMSLALDLMEEFRAYLGDRLVLTLINRQQIQPRHFNVLETGAVVMSDDARKTIVAAYQTRKREILTHPYLKEKMELGLVPYVQAQLLSRHLRGELDAYPPFLMR